MCYVNRGWGLQKGVTIFFDRRGGLLGAVYKDTAWLGGLPVWGFRMTSLHAAGVALVHKRSKGKKMKGRIRNFRAGK